MPPPQPGSEPVSPLANTPMPGTPPIANASVPPTSPANGSLPPLPSIVTPGQQDPTSLDTSTTEARDYLNGGSPHAHVAPPVSPGPALRNKSLPVLPTPIVSGGLDTDSSRRDDNDAQDAYMPGRRSVQFARSETQLEIPATHTRRESVDDPETPSKSRGGTLMSKLKALTANAGLQTPKISGGQFQPSPSEPTSTTANDSPATVRTRPRSVRGPSQDNTELDADADADAEETADEANIPGSVAAAKRKKRKSRRPKKAGMWMPSVPNRFMSDLETPHTTTYNRLLRRRASMPDTSAARDGVVSEGEARDQMMGANFRRGNSWVHPTMRPGEVPDDTEAGVTPGRRAGYVRRSTVFGGGMSDGDALTPRRPFFNSERASTYGAQKWKQVKSTLKLLRQKKEERPDYYKSAELMAELRAGAPAVLMLASMIQRDEHGNKRIPVLLEQLKLTVRDSTPMPDDDSDRHWLFTMDLEYGSGPSRMRWTVVRTIRDIYNLHFRYKFAMSNDKYMPGRLDLGARPKQPKFPYSAFPYLRGARNKGDDSDDDDQASIRADDTAGEGMGNESAGLDVLLESDAEGPPGPRRQGSRGNPLSMRRRSTGITDPGDLPEGQTAANLVTRKQRYVEKQRRILEKYLSTVIRWLMFRADSNRLCRFLELSALGVRLAAEGSYHGKEGFLHIQTSKGLDFRRVLAPAKVISRHSRKWFLVRQSYLVCVESPENMNIYDVYLVDDKFSIGSKRSTLKLGSSEKRHIDLSKEPAPEKHHTLTLRSSERQVRLFSRNQSVMRQFEDSINEMLKQTPWHQKKRFDSFAPVRQNVFAQWLVDGRDYMWNVSRAINMARDVIYIHDWWLSPELYMRRPACISQKWRLDRLLQKKAREGVKIFIIIYRNVEAAVPIDSEYTKFSLLNLHPNIFVQRSPNQFKKNQFFFAHHEKVCVVDHDVAFVGGIDLCFGRWDCPQHPIVDDKPTGFESMDQPKDSEHCQLFPGKDYSNPRIQDFFRLNEPYEEMYDRTRVPRMPWHDVSMQVVGQPARDLTRHFVQRWNYLRRGRKPTRPLPFLLPPPDAKLEDLEALGLSGTCEVQILRSATTWSLGIEHTEHSIQTAYVKMIEESEHFVYMENQFFITSTDVYNTRIVNRIGDALVDRIVRAHQNDEDWRCVIVIPLMPGFQNTVDEQEGTSVRLILMCQYRSICRGETSIFGRLRAVGIEPEDYINFFSLRQWGIMGNDSIVTEQLYIHAKTIIVDDRVALIGSANINERSMLGSRDSECAAIVRDTDTLWSTMAGKPYQVGRFAHTLRLRLMREHLGLDVDEILEQERQQELNREAFENEMDGIYAEDSNAQHAAGPSSGRRGHAYKNSEPIRLPSFNHSMDMAQAEAIHEADSSSSSSSSSSESAGSPSRKGKERKSDKRVTGNMQHELDVSGYGPDHWKSAEEAGVDDGRDSVIVNGREVLVNDVSAQGKGSLKVPKHSPSLRPLSESAISAHNDKSSPALDPERLVEQRTGDHHGLPGASHSSPSPLADDMSTGVDEGGPADTFHPMAADIKLAKIDKDCMLDPVHPDFIDDIWSKIAANNTKLYRRVFRCMPDSEVATWAEYRDHVDYSQRFKESMDPGVKPDEADPKNHESGHADNSGTAAGAGVGAPAFDVIQKSAHAEHDKGHHLHAEPEKPKIVVPSVQGGELNEKPAIGEPNEAPAQQEKGPSLASLDTRTATAAEDTRQETPSPVYSQGNVPFPTLDPPHAKFLEPQAARERDRRTTFSTLDKPASRDTSNGGGGSGGVYQVGSLKRRRRGTTKGSRRGFTIDDMPSRADAEKLLGLVQGHLVQFPYDWLLTEENNGNWGYQVDGVAPIAIYD